MKQKLQENQLNTGTSKEVDSHEHLYELIKGCIFEDGMSNAAIEYLKEVYKNDPEEVAYIISVISEYDEGDPEIIGGLCRCLCWLGDYDNLDPLVKKYATYFLEDCIQSKDSYCQESAIMLCEEWETAMCLDLLINELRPCNKLIEQYLNDVINDFSKRYPLKTMRITEGIVAYHTRMYDVRYPDDCYGKNWYDFPSEVIKDDDSIEKFNPDKIKQTLKDKGIDIDNIIFFDGLLTRILGNGDPEPFAFKTSDITICIDRFLEKHPEILDHDKKGAYIYYYGHKRWL